MTSISRLARLLPLGLWLAAPNLASAQTQFVDLLATQDNTLFESQTGDLSSGVGPRGIVGATAQSKKRRYLVQFDVAGAIPSGSVIDGVALHLHTLALSGQGGPTFFQDLHRVQRAWGEGTSNSGNSGQGAPATAGDATWIHAIQPGQLWSQAGGDWALQPSASFDLSSLGPFALSSVGLVADVQSWLDSPATNFGWLCKGVSEGPSTTVVFASREALDPTQAPVLRVQYTPPSGTVTSFCEPAMLNSAGLAVTLQAQLGVGSHPGWHLEASGGPAQWFGYFLVGSRVATTPLPISQGLLCLSTDSPERIGRYNVANTQWNSMGFFDGAGVFQNAVGTSSVGSGLDVPDALPFSIPTSVSAGETWHFQLWYRDQGGSSNLSTGVSVTF